MYEKPNGRSKKVMYVVLELAGIGDMFDVVANSGAFEEPMARFYARQFFEGLAYCHENGITHRDIKIENCLMDDEYNLKINDFGFAGPVHGSKGSGWFTTNLGTPANMAPELLAKSAYQGTQVDLFASGVVIFTMLSRHPPFVKASSTDYYYKYFPQNKSKKFWDAHSKSKEAGYYSADFMHFFNSLM
jgi:serine/threonine protein kinase